MSGDREYNLPSAPPATAGKNSQRTLHIPKPNLRGNVTPVVHWLDVRVIYVRVSACPVEDDLWPEILQFRCPPREITTELELNGARVAAQEEVHLFLKRDRVDSESSEATYVSTDRLRVGGTLVYGVSYDGESILDGVLNKSEPGGRAGKGHDGLPPGDQAVVTQSQCLRLGWTLDASCTVGAGGCVFLRAKHDYKTLLSPSTAEVCIVGRFLGSPVILTDTVTLNARRRNVQKAALGAIAESDEGRNGLSHDSSPCSTDEEAGGRGSDEVRHHIHPLPAITTPLRCGVCSVGLTRA